MPSFICCLHAAYGGNIQKAQPSAFRNSIKFLSPCSRLFLCNPIVMHWSWNQSPAVHAASVWFQAEQKEEAHNNSTDSRINKREKIWEKKKRKNPGPDPREGPCGKLVLQVRYGSELREPRRGPRAANRQTDRQNMDSHSPGPSVPRFQNYGQLRSTARVRVCVCVFSTADSSGPLRLSGLHNTLHKRIVEVTKAFVCALLSLNICLIRCSIRRSLMVLVETYESHVISGIHLKPPLTKKTLLVHFKSFDLFAFYFEGYRRKDWLKKKK